MKNKLCYIISIFLIYIWCASCQSNQKTSNNKKYNFEYDYEIKHYFSDDLENCQDTKFYLNDRLIRETNKEGGCIRYVYDTKGKLLETNWSRNCGNGYRTIFIYDSLDNHIAYYKTMDTIINLDTISINQIYFYDSENRLIKERTDKGNNALNGEEYEIWKYYIYTDTLKNEEITIYNKDTVWIGKYSYDAKNNLTKIHRARNSVYESEIYKYNEKDLLIEKKIISTKSPITPETSFSAKNNTEIYEYDTENILITKTILNHKGQMQIKSIYKKVAK